MAALPPDAVSFRIAAVVPCKYESCSWTARPNGGPPCDGCLGDGTRTVVTDVEVEPTTDVWSDAEDAYYDEHLRLHNDEREVWREVPR